MNPLPPGEYAWLVTFFHDLRNSCETFHESTTSEIVLAYKPGELQLFNPWGKYWSGVLTVTAGSTITVIGNGFRLSEPVNSVTLGPLELYPRHDGLTYHDERNARYPGAATDAMGVLEFNLPVPGLESGPQTLEVQVGERTVRAEFIFVPSGGSFDPIPTVRDHIARAKMEDNFVVAFHFNKYANEWQFYDPRIDWYDNDLHHFRSGRCYWILVKEPVEVELGWQLRKLTCRADGNCWNRLIW